MTQSASQQRGEEEERMRRRKECPISFSPADQSNKHAGFISEPGYGMSRLCVCVSECVFSVHTLSPQYK